MKFVRTRFQALLSIQKSVVQKIGIFVGPSISFLQIFYPETTDIYDRKNMPKTVYCIHALSLYLFKLGKAPQMKDLYGIAKFTGMK